jgi:2',3'-cyclic-nucleotide 2'-phosphodiesterase (5'-nucleotidase family)
MRSFKITIFCIFFALLSVSLASGRQSEIRIIYVNDFHGFAEPYKPRGSEEMLGGIAYAAGAVEKLRKEKPSLLLAAGDMIRGNNWANLFQGESVIKLMNLMKFDAMVVGNHEFDFGQKVLKKRIAEAKFPILGANVEGFPLLQPYVIKELQGVKVAIIGVVTEDTAFSTDPRKVAGLRFLDPGDTVEKYLKVLKKKADLVVVLSHLGHLPERALAQKVKGIHVIVGGHSHTKVLKPVVIGNTIVVQAWEHGKALGVLDLTLKDGKIIKFQGHLQEIKPAAGNPDKNVQNLVAGYARKIDPIMNETIGETAVDLDGENVRIRETNLGDLVADILRNTAGADLAIINGGSISIRVSINKGKVRVKDVYAALPFDNYPVAVSLTGKQIKEALEHGLSGLEQRAGRFPQVSGLTFSYNPAAPAGSRIREVAVGGHPLVPEKEYVVATTDFLAAGGDGYKVFGEAIRSVPDYSEQGGLLKSQKVVYSDYSKWLRDLVIDYIKSQKKISPQVEGRIKEKD